MPASDAADHHHSGPSSVSPQALVPLLGEEGVGQRPQGSHVLSTIHFVMVPTD
jgi:hypothetical protein